MQVVTQKHGTASKWTSAKTSKTSLAPLLAKESMLMSSWHCLAKKRKERTRKKSQYSWTSTMSSKGKYSQISDSILKRKQHILVDTLIFKSFSKLCCYCWYSGEDQNSSSLHLVQIYFDTATFDEIERDKKVKFEGQLSLIGGTMGLLTGFSIISGIELFVFLIKFFASLRTNKDEIVSAVERKFQNHLKWKFGDNLINFFVPINKSTSTWLSWFSARDSNNKQ